MGLFLYLLLVYLRVGCLVYVRLLVCYMFVCFAGYNWVLLLLVRFSIALLGFGDVL